MKKILFFFLVATLCISDISAQTFVQGISNPAIENNYKTPHPNILKSDNTFSFEDIEFWVGEGDNEAALVIEWHDDYSPDALVWGYRWNGEACGHDMIVAVAKADPRLVLLTQFTGPMGYTICGIGYNEEPLNIWYDFDSAVEESRNAFCFEEPITNPLLGQTSVPETPEEDVAKAIEEGLNTGVIFHPLNAEVYGYPSYDYDSWKCEDATHWNAGWYDGYWSYFVREGQTSDFSYSGLGATSRKLNNGSWDAWNWNGDMSTMEGTAPGEVFTAATNVQTDIRNNITDKAEIITDGNDLRFINMNGYRCNVCDLAGNIVKSFTVSGSYNYISLSLPAGIYIVNAINGSDNINKKFIIR